MDTKLFAERLLALRTAANMSQAQVYNALNMAAAVYNRYEKGSRLPATEQLALIANFYEVSVDYLLGRTDNPEINR